MKFLNKYNSDFEELNSINITPFTDCMMVLLIIFMITGTALTQAGFNINLPKTVWVMKKLILKIYLKN